MENTNQDMVEQLRKLNLEPIQHTQGIYELFQ